MSRLYPASEGSVPLSLRVSQKCRRSVLVAPGRRAEQIPRSHTADMRDFQPPFRFGLGIGSRWSLLSHCLGTHDGTQQLWNRSNYTCFIDGADKTGWSRSLDLH